MLIFMGYSHSDGKHRHGIYECHCGNVTVKRMSRVSRGGVRSCDCLYEKHGFYYHPLRHKHTGMMARCYNSKSPKYKYYGARGIFVCPEWRNNYEAFYLWAIKSGWRLDLQVDRIDNDGPYSPDNCRFITLKENVRNSRHVKLTMAKAQEIRKRLKAGEDFGVLASEFGVTRAAISDINTKRTWNA